MSQLFSSDRGCGGRLRAAADRSSYWTPRIEKTREISSARRRRSLRNWSTYSSLTARDCCVRPILPEVAERLDLPLMVGNPRDSYRTAYTVTMDHKSARTGITAQERCRTIRELVRPDSQPRDFVRPGHILPLVAKEGGVLRRAGHTEAAVDLARLAGLQPAGVLCEILDETGDRASRDHLPNSPSNSTWR